jgi:hypothetical protein
MSKLIAIPSVLAASLVTLLAVSCQSSSFQNPTIINTTDKQRDWHMNYLQARISSLQPASGGVQINGRVFQSTDAETRVVPIGHKLTFPDDHGRKVYTITDIHSDGIVIEYESTFDHRSFGKDLVERDTGTFELSWLGGTPSRSPAEVLRGLQSLQRVRLKLPPGLPQAVRDKATKQLQELLPQLDTAGTTDDWALEFTFGVSIVEEAAVRSSGPTPMGPVIDCRCRLLRTVVVDGRSATAVAYEGTPFAGSPPPTFSRNWQSLRPDSKEQVLRNAIAGFAKAWRKANPDEDQTSRRD